MRKTPIARPSARQTAGPRAGVPAPRAEDRARSYQGDLDRLARAIQRFRVDAQRFFAGDLHQPPEELREEITADLRRLRNANLQGAAASFRLGTLEAQFNSHLGLFGRRLRQRETAGRAAEKGPGLDPVQGVVVGARSDRGAAEALFKGLYPGAAGTAKPKMDLERFRSYIDRQAETIRQKTGCAEIRFRIAVEEGKMKLKAKPIRRPS